MKILREYMHGYLANRRGITLIALIITIIVLVILAGVIIALSTNNNGVITKADLAKMKQEEDSIYETLATQIFYLEDGNGIDLIKTHANMKEMENTKVEPNELEDGATSFNVRVKGKYKEYKYLVENGKIQNLELFDFTITANFKDAVIKINGEELSTVKASSGEVLNWSVSKEGYITQSGTYTMEAYEHNIEITLVQPIFKISTTQTGLTIKINEEEKSELQAPVGTVINWSVEKEGFESKSGTYTLVESDYTQNVTLREYFTFSINLISPTAATVKINNIEQTSCIVADGDNVSYSVSCSGYNTQSSSVTVTKNQTVEIKLYKTVNANLTSSSLYNSLCNRGSYSRSMSSSTANSFVSTSWGYGDFDRSVLTSIDGKVENVKLNVTSKNSTGSGTEQWEFFLRSGTYSTSGTSTGSIATGWNNIRLTRQNQSDTFTNITMEQVRSGIFVYMTTKVKRTISGMGSVPTRTLTLNNIYLTVNYYPAEDVASWPTE